MMKTLLSATALTLLLAGSAAAQQSATDPARTPAARSETRTDAMPGTAAATVQQSGQIDSQKLIGTDIKNPEGNDIGEIESVLMNRDGKVDAVIVGVGGFLGLGERLVALKWTDLQVQENGRRVVANYTKDQLKSMPEFKYAENQRRGGVYTRDGDDRRDNPARTDTARSDTVVTTTPMTVARGDANRDTTAGRDRNVTASADNAIRRDNDRGGNDRGGNDAVNNLGQLSADKIIGQNVVNARGENIGEIEDLVLDKNQKVFAVISVGGFLGMGDRDVAVPFDQLRLGDNRMIMMSEANKDVLKGMEPYKKDGYSKWNRQGPVTTR